MRARVAYLEKELMQRRPPSAWLIEANAHAPPGLRIWHHLLALLCRARGVSLPTVSR